MKHIRIKYLADVEPIKKIVKGDWIDLRSAIDIDLKAGQSANIPLGIAMELPKGYEAHVVPRSSTFKKWHILQTNSMGIIDGSYCGDNDEWSMPIIATEDTHISKNDRICQFRIMKNMPSVTFDVVKVLGNADRKGFGSTGVN